MQMGIHSGPVTAGVLRGERSRFQLFGDTMNTAARMEHNVLRDKIQLSQETADLLIAAGKTNWLTRREDGMCSWCCWYCRACVNLHSCAIFFLRVRFGL